MADNQERLPKTANEIRASRQSAQHADRMELDRRFAQKEGLLGQKLRDAYGERRDTLRDALRAAEQRLSNDTGLRGLMWRVTGRAAEDRHACEAMRKELADIDQRESEERSRLDAEKTRDLAALQAKHEEQRRRDEQGIAERAEKAPAGRAAFGRTAPAHSPAREQSERAGEELAREDNSRKPKGKRAQFAKNKTDLVKQRDRGHDDGR